MSEHPKLKTDLNYETGRVDRIIDSGFSDVYDITVEDTHCFFADNILAHNCGEYNFLDENSCNLSSLNLIKFIDDHNTFQTEDFCKAVKIFITAQDIVTGLASYPTKEIAKNSVEYRPLGLGYTNLGASLIKMGIPYSSEEGRQIASTFTAVMTSEAYVTSKDIANTLSPFYHHKENSEYMARVIKKHWESFPYTLGVLTSVLKDKYDVRTLDADFYNLSSSSIKNSKFILLIYKRFFPERNFSKIIFYKTGNSLKSFF